MSTSAIIKMVIGAKKYIQLFILLTPTHASPTILKATNVFLFSDLSATYPPYNAIPIAW